MASRHNRRSRQSRRNKHGGIDLSVRRSQPLPVSNLPLVNVETVDISLPAESVKNPPSLAKSSSFFSFGSKKPVAAGKSSFAFSVPLSKLIELDNKKNNAGNTLVPTELSVKSGSLNIVVYYKIVYKGEDAFVQFHNIELEYGPVRTGLQFLSESTSIKESTTFTNIKVKPSSPNVVFNFQFNFMIEEIDKVKKLKLEDFKINGVVIPYFSTARNDYFLIKLDPDDPNQQYGQPSLKLGGRRRHTRRNRNMRRTSRRSAGRSAGRTAGRTARRTRY